METKTLILTADIADAACGLVVRDELDIDPAKLDSRRVGNLMRKLRFTHKDQPGTHKKGWLVGKRELANLAISYGIVNRDPSSASASDAEDPNVTNVTDGYNVTPQEASFDVIVESECFDDANALAWQAQGGF